MGKHATFTGEGRKEWKGKGTRGEGGERGGKEGRKDLGRKEKGSVAAGMFPNRSCDSQFLLSLHQPQPICILLCCPPLLGRMLQRSSWVLPATEGGQGDEVVWWGAQEGPGLCRDDMLPKEIPS